jgi:hypothetical protein
MTTPTAAKHFGPRQQHEAKTLATHLWGWGVDVFQAAELNDVERVAELAAAISANAIELSRLAKRASR